MKIGVSIRILVGAVVCGALAALLCGCSVAGSAPAGPSPSSTSPRVELHVLAASSLKAVLTSISPAFESSHGVKIVASYAASGALRKQIEAGAPADVFLSASASHVASLAAQGLVAPKAGVTFAGNDLVILVPAGNPTAVLTPADLRKTGRLATGDPAITPQGAAAKAWLSGLGMWDALGPKFVFAQNAAQTTAYVSRGEVDAAVGFASDAHGRTDIAVAYAIPGGEYPPITYVAAPVKSSSHAKLAEEFARYLLTPPVQDALAGAGFAGAPSESGGGRG